jgi:hypothetical protein
MDYASLTPEQRAEQRAGLQEQLEVMAWAKGVHAQRVKVERPRPLREGASKQACEIHANECLKHDIAEEELASYSARVAAINAALAEIDRAAKK